MGFGEFDQPSSTRSHLTQCDDAFSGTHKFSLANKRYRLFFLQHPDHESLAQVQFLPHDFEHVAAPVNDVNRPHLVHRHEVGTASTAHLVVLRFAHLVTSPSECHQGARAKQRPSAGLHQGALYVPKS